MARFPSYRAPRASEVLRPGPFVPPQPPPLHPEEQRCLDAVLAAPEQDEPRRAYAEWLAGRGERRRAEFIRDQLAGRPAVPDPTWADAYSPWSARDLVYRRGFVEAMSLAGRAFISLGEPLFRMTPLREVRLVAIAPYLDELAATPHLARLAIVSLRGNHIEDTHPAIEKIRRQGVEVRLSSSSLP